MSVVVSPNCDVAIFNPSCFTITSTGVGGGVNIPYLEYPYAQGNETLQGADHTGDVFFNDDLQILNNLFDGGGFAGADGYVITSATGRISWEPTQTIGIPAGSIVPSVSNVALEGFLLCNGGSYQASQYPLLYDVIGLTYTLGQPEGYFNVPTFQTRIPIGCSATGTIGTAYNGNNPIYGGSTALDANQFPAHYHTINWSLSNNQKMCVDYNKTDNTTINNTGQDRCVSCNKISLPYPQPTRSQPPYTDTNGSTNNTNQNYTADHYPPFVAVNWLIKV